MLVVACSRNCRCGDRRFEPGDFLRGETPQCLNQALVALTVFPGEARQALPEITCRSRRGATQ